MDFLNLSSNQLLALFYAEANIVAILIFSLIARRSFHEINKQTKNKYFHDLLLLHILYFFIEIFWAACYFNVMPNPDILMKVMKSLKMTIVGLGTYTWFMYFEISTKSKMVNSEKKRILMFLPIIFQVLIDYVLIFTLDLNRKDIIGYISSFVLILVPLLYMIHTSGSTCILYLKNKNDNVRKDTLVYLIYPIVLVIVAILQVIISDLPVICFGTSIAMLALYINRLGDMISLDPLTGTYNRNALIKGLNDLFKNDEKIYCFIMDLDRFKQINDNFGHIEGDEALVKFSNILKKTCDNPNLLFGRYGGDEFVIFAKNYNDELAKELIDKIQNNLKEAQAESKKYVMQISIGYAQKAEYESIRALIERADKMLYEIKRKKKNKNNNKK